MKRNDGPSVIVRMSACVLAIPAFTFGLFVIAHGHLTPGGGFAGGAVAATLVALILAAGGRKAAGGISNGVLSVMEAVGLMAFALLGLLGLGTTFFWNFLANSGSLFGAQVPFGINPGDINTAGVLPLMNFAVGFEVFAALSLVMVVMFRYGEEGQ